MRISIPFRTTATNPSEARIICHCIVYTRRGCHLCDEAAALLIDHGLKPQLVDIDQDPQLQERYTDCVPVVVIDGQERFRGRVNPVLLRRLLKGRTE